MNSEDENFRLWELKDDSESRGLLAFKAFLAAQKQDSDSLDKFHLALLKLRHEEKRELNEIATVLEAAKKADLDMDRFQEDISDPSFKARIGEDYAEGINRYGAFGVPTIIFDNSEATFLKMDPIPEEKQAVNMLDSLLNLVRNHPNIKEIKRPAPAL